MHGLTGHLYEWAEKQPDATAVESQDQSITYAELHRQSSALAAGLARMGVTPGARVGLWLRKSVESVVAIYGVLKAGAAYVPIDPSAPRGRVRGMLVDCGTACVITHRDQLDRPPGDQEAVELPCSAVSTGGVPATVAKHPVVAWERAVTISSTVDTSAPVIDPRSLAYILQTSGSQGRPKGVALSHLNARAFVDWSVREFGLCQEDRVSSHAPLHFDLSILDVFATGRAGGCLVLIPESQVGMGGVLNKFVVDRRITVWYSVPNALTRMLTAKNSATLSESDLRVVLFAGETFPINQVRRLRDAVPTAELYNLYGPTETNVCTFHRVRESDVVPDRTEPLPIGRACDYATTFVLDESGRPCEPWPGVTGELCVAGDSRMLGYWNDSALSSAKTVLVPRDGAEPLHAYRTGDLVRIDDEHNHVFLGREDDLVKIRGHRVELGEIESVLSDVETVREAVCLAVGDGNGENRIEAFLVSSGVADETAALRRHCARLLPRYMIPEKFHFVASLPRASTGKIDRRRLIT